MAKKNGKSIAKKPTAPKPAAKAKIAKKIAWPSGPKAFEKASSILGRKPTLPGVKGIPKKHADFITSGYILTTVIEAIHSLIKEPKEIFPRYDDGSTKYFDWRWVKSTKKQPGGVGFSYANVGHTHSSAHVGSRFQYKNPEVRAHMRRPEFKKYWIQYILIQEPEQK